MSWNRTTSLAEALVGPGFGRDSNFNGEGLSSQAARKVFQAISEESVKKLKIILSTVEPNELNEVVNARDSADHDRTALMLCCWVKDSVARQRMVDLLLRHEADANLCDADGKTALCHATERSLIDVLQALIASSKIDPNIPDKAGNTPLHYAAINRNDLSVRLLVRSFHRFDVLDIDAKNNKGETALSIAAANGNMSMACVLVNSGKASIDTRLSENGERVYEVLEKAGVSLHQLKSGEWKLEDDELSDCLTSLNLNHDRMQSTSPRSTSQPSPTPPPLLSFASTSQNEATTNERKSPRLKFINHIFSKR